MNRFIARAIALVKPRDCVYCVNSTACKSQGPAEGAARTNNITHFLVGGLNHPLGDIHYFLTPPESQTPLF